MKSGGAPLNNYSAVGKGSSGLLFHGTPWSGFSMVNINYSRSVFLELFLENYSWGLPGHWNNYLRERPYFFWGGSPKESTLPGTIHGDVEIRTTSSVTWVLRMDLMIYPSLWEANAIGPSMIVLGSVWDIKPTFGPESASISLMMAHDQRCPTEPTLQPATWGSMWL